MSPEDSATIKIDIPLIPITLFLYIGKDSFNTFLDELQINKIEFDVDVNTPKVGYSINNFIWIYEYDRKILFHELAHFLDWLYYYIGCTEEAEFKAFLAEYVYYEVLNRIEK